MEKIKKSRMPVQYGRILAKTCFNMQEAIQHLRSNDPVIAQIIDRVGDYAIQFRDPDFETLVRSIVYQQLSGRVAAVIFGRLTGAVGGKLTPANILKLRPARMRSLGLSKQKTTYIRDLARHTRDGKVVFEELSALEDHLIIERLTQVKGIGVWTAHMFLIFALRRTDILPTGDLGVRNAMRKAYGLEALPTPDEMEAMARCWRPYCSVASWYLWRSLDGGANL
jgi:DNA-3-methyladenine glycosylase II